MDLSLDQIHSTLDTLAISLQQKEAVSEEWRELEEGDSTISCQYSAKSNGYNIALRRNSWYSPIFREGDSLVGGQRISITHLFFTITGIHNSVSIWKRDKAIVEDLSTGKSESLYVSAIGQWQFADYSLGDLEKFLRTTE